MADKRMPELTSFHIGWAIHSKLFLLPGGIVVPEMMPQQEQKGDYTKRNLSPLEQLALILMMEALTLKDPANSNRKIVHDKDSPVFPMLLTDLLAMLHNLGDNHQPGSMWIEECLMETLESIVPDALSPEVDKAMRKELADSNGLANDSIQTINNIVKEWTGQFQDPQYVSPFLWVKNESEQRETERWLKEQENIKTISADEFCQPFSGAAPSFSRPLPPPHLPLYEYDEGIDGMGAVGEVHLPSNEQERNDLTAYLQSEYVWLTPTTMRLMLIPGEEDDTESTEQYKYALKLLKKRCFDSSLPPNDQRALLDMLSEAPPPVPSKPQPPQQKQKRKSSKQHSSRRETSAAAAAQSAMAENEEVRIRLVGESGLTPKNLHQMVGHNPIIANECLLVILQYSPENVKNDYLSALIGMDMSLQSMEVVNRLATYSLTRPDKEPILHPEYINLFISSCTAACEHMQDRHAQNRLVRLVCVFIQSLLKNSIISVDDVYFELQSFCIEFSRIREAATLYKLLKANDSTGASGN
ncbi:MAG: hypothetical protein SGILL_008789 [Bacillariaceae sp.]